MNFLCIYLGEKGGGGGALMHVYVWEHIAAFTTVPLDGCLRNLVGIKCSWSLTSVVVFQPDPPPPQGRIPGGAKIGHAGSPSSTNFLQTGRLQQQTEFIAMI